MEVARGNGNVHSRTSHTMIMTMMMIMMMMKVMNQFPRFCEDLDTTTACNLADALRYQQRIRLLSVECIPLLLVLVGFYAMLYNRFCQLKVKFYVV